MATNNKKCVSSVGNCMIYLIFNSVSTKFVQKKFLHVPELGYSLPAFINMDDPGLSETFSNYLYWIRNNAEINASGKMKKHLYIHDTLSHYLSPETKQTMCLASLQLWKDFFGHFLSNFIPEMVSKKTFNGLNIGDWKPRRYLKRAYM